MGRWWSVQRNRGRGAAPLTPAAKSQDNKEEDRDPEQVGANAGSTNASLYTVLGRTYLLTIDRQF